MDLTMDKKCFVRAMALLVVVFSMALELRAQRTGSDLVAYQVSGLTSAARDQLAQQAEQGGEVKLTYACVPAGILVFEPANGATRADLGRRVESRKASRAHRQNGSPPESAGAD